MNVIAAASQLPILWEGIVKCGDRPSGSPSIIRFTVHHQVHRPSSGSPSIIRSTDHHQVDHPVHRPISGSPAIIRSTVLHRVDRPSSGPPTTIRSTDHHQVHGPSSGPPTITRSTDHHHHCLINCKQKYNINRVVIYLYYYKILRHVYIYTSIFPSTQKTCLIHSVTVLHTC